MGGRSQEVSLLSLFVGVGLSLRRAACEDGAIHLWAANSNFARPSSVSSCALLFFRRPLTLFWMQSVLNAHEKDTVTSSLVFTRDGRQFATRGGDGTVKRASPLLRFSTFAKASSQYGTPDLSRNPSSPPPTFPRSTTRPTSSSPPTSATSSLELLGRIRVLWWGLWKRRRRVRRSERAVGRSWCCGGRGLGSCGVLVSSRLDCATGWWLIGWYCADISPYSVVKVLWHPKINQVSLWPKWELRTKTDAFADRHRFLGRLDPRPLLPSHLSQRSHHRRHSRPSRSRTRRLLLFNSARPTHHRTAFAADVQGRLWRCGSCGWEGWEEEEGEGEARSSEDYEA